jgi:hypothetical protein
VRVTVRVTVALLLFLTRAVLAQTASPRFLYIYRDSLKSGVDSAYRAIENDGAQICADFKCPNPYLGLESLAGTHQAFWINAFASAADTARVASAYAGNRVLADSLGLVAKRKETLIGTPIAGFAVYRPELSRGPVWPVAGARYVLVYTTRSRRPANGSVWEMTDSTLYVFRPLKSAQQPKALADGSARLFVVRPNWSMPAPEWVAADPEFWRLAPVPKSTH